MDFLQTLKSGRGALIRLKSELFWFGGRGWDGAPDRVCLILDAVGADAAAAAARTARAVAQLDFAHAAVALLLIEDRPQWVWVGESDLELIT